MGILLFDPTERDNFSPVTYTRAFADMYAGTMPLKQWWQHITGENIYILTQEYLRKKYEPCPVNESYIYINAAAIATPELWKAIQLLSLDEILVNKDRATIAFKSKNNYQQETNFKIKRDTEILHDTALIQYPHQLVAWNKKFFALQKDYLIKKERKSAISATNLLINPNAIFIEEGCTIEGCTINASDGPVYISKNCTIMESACIRGPFFLGENSVIKMGAKIYGATTIGKKCTIGGELKNVIIHDYSNKAHDGYLGDSIMGSWCNLGAGTSCSNVKNTGGDVKILHAKTGKYMTAGLKFGTIMGDYSRTAINTSINSGTRVGVCCSLHDAKSFSTEVRNFSWGNKGQKSYKIMEALKHIHNWMNFKNEALLAVEIEILEYLFNKAE